MLKLSDFAQRMTDLLCKQKLHRPDSPTRPYRGRQTDWRSARFRRETALSPSMEQFVDFQLCERVQVNSQTIQIVPVQRCDLTCSQRMLQLSPESSFFARDSRIDENTFPKSFVHDFPLFLSLPFAPLLRAAKATENKELCSMRFYFPLSFATALRLSAVLDMDIYFEQKPENDEWRTERVNWMKVKASECAPPRRFLRAPFSEWKNWATRV